MKKSKSEIKRQASNMSLREIIDLKNKLQEAIELIKYVELCDAYPDLSSFKYKDAYGLIRPKIKFFIDNILNE